MFEDVVNQFSSKGKKESLNGVEKFDVMKYLPQIILFVGVVFLIFAIVFLINSFSVVACENKECLISEAENCKNAELTLIEEAGTFEYLSKGCLLTKTILALDESESEEIKQLLEMKSMTCGYEKGNFDANWVNSLILGIEKCEGELAETLGQLVLSV